MSCLGNLNLLCYYLNLLTAPLQLSIQANSLSKSVLAAAQQITPVTRAGAAALEPEHRSRAPAFHSAALREQLFPSLNASSGQWEECESTTAPSPQPEMM